MLKIKLSDNIVLDDGQSMLSKSLKGGLNYPLFHRMSKGNWNDRTLEALARFLYANGYSAEVLRDVKFSEIFLVTEETDELL